MTAHRQLALSLERGFTRFQENGKNILSSIYSGTERASWYSSCFFDKYDDICQELKEEDRRMIAAIKAIYNHKEIVVFMIELYIKYLLKNQNEKSKDNIIIKITGFLARNRTGLVTKLTMSYLIAKSISGSMNFTIKTRERIGKVSNVVLTILTFYSYVQKASISSRKLKILNPSFYNILYNQQLEMLYFIIEPALQKNIGMLSENLRENDVLMIIKDLIK